MLGRKEAMPPSDTDASQPTDSQGTDSQPTEKAEKPPAAVVEDAYAAWLWIDERVASFSTLARRQLGHRAIDAALDVLLDLTDAAYSPRGPLRLERLAHVNRSLARLRILLRGARDRRHLSIAQHEHAMRLVDNLGRQVGGWLRAERGSRRP